MLKFCPECGSKIIGGKFCGNCGADLTKYGAKNTAAEEINAGPSLDDALGNLMNYATEKQEEEAIARDFEIKDGVLVKYKGNGVDVVIPKTVTRIGKDALGRDKKVESLTIPKSVNAIDDCLTIKTVRYNGNIADWCQIKGLNMLMSGHATLFIDGKEVKGDLIIPQGVKFIENGAFMNCKGITSVSIPTGVTGIGYGAFMDCHSLTSVNLPDSLERIDKSAFSECISLERLEIPDSVITIGAWSFYHCRELMSVRLGKRVNTIGEYAFYGCKGFRYITVPQSVKNIGENAFSKCSNLAEINYLGDIENWCEINGVDNLPSHDRTLLINGNEISGELRIPYGVKFINNGAFCGCKRLESVYIPDSVKRIGNFAFSTCFELAKVSLPSDCIYESGSFPSYCQIIKR